MKRILIFLPIVTFVFSLMFGRYNISLHELLDAFVSKVILLDYDEMNIVESVLFKVRIPRILTAMLVGAVLSISGAAFQGMFKNPMVSPDILGASAGAAFGAALGILFSFGIVGIQILSFTFGMIAVGITCLISYRVSKGNNVTLVLILAGILIGTLCKSFISLIKYVADPYSKLPSITFWLMGSLASINIKDFYMVFVITIIGIIPLMLLRWRLNVLAFDEEEARALGMNTSRLRLIIIVCATLMTSSVVAISGLIGWVGLIVPHFVRMMVGPNFKDLLPASMLVGSTYLLIVDNIARTMYAVEIPLGILTSIIGAPFFIYLLLNTRKGWI